MIMIMVMMRPHDEKDDDDDYPFNQCERSGKATRFTFMGFKLVGPTWTPMDQMWQIVAPMITGNGQTMISYDCRGWCRLPSTSTGNSFKRTCQRGLSTGERIGYDNDHHHDSDDDGDDDCDGDDGYNGDGDFTVDDDDLFDKCINQGTDKFALVCVGHSLGGGTAAILAIILRW